MKLNLGGGAKREEGFLNVDLCEIADIRHDLREPLPFEDNSVEEILAVHVIESFYKWQFPPILKDWYRVLKPEGKMTIEFTDLDLTIGLYLSEDSDERRMGRWGLYGEQAHKEDPITYHHYVYQTEDLRNLLKESGFNNFLITKEGIQHEPLRDNRIICSKTQN